MQWLWKFESSVNLLENETPLVREWAMERLMGFLGDHMDVHMAERLLMLESDSPELGEKPAWAASRLGAPLLAILPVVIDRHLDKASSLRNLTSAVPATPAPRFRVCDAWTPMLSFKLLRNAL